jgi:hypothetical protein
LALTDDIAELVFAIEKFPAYRGSFNFPGEGDKIEIELENDDGRMVFHLDVIRSPKRRLKATYNLRYRRIYSIRRMDLQGNHTNPPVPAPSAYLDAFRGYQFVQEDHLHLYHEDFGDKWAVPLSAVPELGIASTDSLTEKLVKFLTYCNVRVPTFTQQAF